MWSISSTAKNKAFLSAAKKRRRELKIPQKIIAHEMGLNVSAYSKIECGYTDLSLDKFIFICKRLNLNAQNFLL
jgi:transcriptional regulator with XRE-family HTH domain